MSVLTLTKTRLRQGIWEGLITGADAKPDIAVLYLDHPIADVALSSVEDGWLVQFPIPAEAIADGVQTLVVTEVSTGDVLASETLLAGDAMGDDIRSELDLLRAELDMLKRAFRRHCVETA